MEEVIGSIPIRSIKLFQQLSRGSSAARSIVRAAGLRESPKLVSWLQKRGLGFEYRLKRRASTRWMWRSLSMQPRDRSRSPEPNEIVANCNFQIGSFEDLVGGLIGQQSYTATKVVKEV